MKKIYLIFHKFFYISFYYFDVLLSKLISRTLKSYGKNIIFGRFFSNKITSPKTLPLEVILSQVETYTYMEMMGKYQLEIIVLGAQTYK